MAEPKNETVIVPDSKGVYQIKVKEFDASGHSTELSVPVPTTVDFDSWSLMQQAVMLKKGMWSKSGINEIIFAIAYAASFHDKNGNRVLDIMQGDVYPTGDGRIATSNKAKVKIAQTTGMIVGIESDIKELPDPINLPGCPLKKDIECTVTIHVKGWIKPIIRKARLSRWFKEKNPNWKERPEHMLELNTIAHACEYVSPTGTDEYETPPNEELKGTSVIEKLKKEKANVETGN